MLALLYFIILAVIALGAAVCVLLSRHPLYGGLSLIVSMVSLAGIYGLVGSPFLGVVQIMVYAGAIMMLVTFVIMVLNGARDSHTPMFDKVSLFVIPAVIVLAGLVGFALVRAPLAFDAATLRGSVALTSRSLFDVAQTGPGYFMLFEVLGLLLLSAMVAAVLLAKKRLGSVASENTEEKH
ncbi:MAG: NADH-quinone oxidoreductase subunit J [Fibrobacter sp.]|jgi:NADH-quinone oxidoreductase subunit J|uniref:NADH-quinone oxidoreductase subunit J family protein n=1 Tax=Fibrobacter sp. UWP2 TaxID=1896216 RepID=UPI00090F1110|nr:NADH-quinone oxidoreductase subunit J [Fibrobacter sp. UWP2]MBO7383891.1 NADH-quinone oxidoreductase subunit J [Fibrobacter sp.]MCR5378532.1 NADH-quinone oxidoreductase subunit J [Fibrobacter sp.]SHJ23175.1 NADH dehydrogenase subunit J [Fibrobacter sp. UWP2]